jgi:hypothetical protein
MSGTAIKMLDGVTTDTPTYGVARYFAPPVPYPYHKVHAAIAGTGAVTATVIVEGSSTGMEGWATEFTITLSGTTTDAYRGTFVAANGQFYRLKVSAITGTGATINAWITD